MSIELTDASLPPVVQRFLRYVRIDTQSNPNSSSVPSTEKQKNLSRVLVDELREIGLDDVSMDQFGYVLATVPGTMKNAANAEPGSNKRDFVLALVSHVDTSPDESGENVVPIVHPPYDGTVVELPGDINVKLDPAIQTALRRHVGQRLITSDGTTLLGSDDKAGVAIMVQLAEDLLIDVHPRPAIRLCFTIDEEIGRGVDHLSLKTLGADVAYTLDGSGIDTISYETFNAAAAYIKVEGRSVHPGYAKGVLVNAVRILSEIIAALPRDEAPESTENRDGYYHAHTTFAGDVTQAAVQVILRDFTDDGMSRRKQFIESLVAQKREEYPQANIILETKDQYKNMRSYIEALDPRTVEYAFEAANDLGIALDAELVRGGTDGARLSERGLPTPNVFNGGYDYHSRFEWNTVENLEHALAYTKALVRCWGRHTQSTN